MATLTLMHGGAESQNESETRTHVRQALTRYFNDRDYDAVLDLLEEGNPPKGYRSIKRMYRIDMAEVLADMLYHDRSKNRFPRREIESDPSNGSKSMYTIGTENVKLRLQL